MSYDAALSGQVVMITGAGRGIQFAIAQTVWATWVHEFHLRTPSGEARVTNIPLDTIRYNDYYSGMERKHGMARIARAPKAQLQGQVFVSLLRTADALTRGAGALIKPFGLSATQYNILRILRGAGERGLACREIGCRLISRDPDITRLLDRMESRGLIARAREDKDRRVVKTRITAEGLRILHDLDEPMQKLHLQQFRRLPAGDLRQLSLLLERARAQVEPPDAPE